MQSRLPSYARSMDRAEDRQKRAMDAALHVAEDLRINVSDAAVIRDSNNTIVHLKGVDLIAKVGTSSLRSDAFTTLHRELEIGRHLAAREAPIAPPASDVRAGPHVHSDTVVTLWTYVEPSPGAKVTYQDLAEMLRTFHGALADFPDELPIFTEALNRAEAALESVPMTRSLNESDRSYLRAVAAEVREELRDRELPRRPLHGDPHLDGNIVVGHNGPVLIDFEAACLGPYEWDLTALRQASAHYSGIDTDLMTLLSRMRSLTVSAWCWMQYGRSPEVDEAARVHLQLLRDNC